MIFLARFIRKLICYLCIPIFVVIFLLYIYFKNEMPDVSTLNDARLQIPLRIYSQDRLLIAEFGEKRRIPVKFEDIPEDIINAFIVTEDYRFYSHPGIDIIGLGRAFIELLSTGQIHSGGSTITMQVAKNFFLTHKKLFSRKIKEIFLALKIEHHLGKNQILELYLNKIYLGNRAYGIEAAAQAYYGKSIKELDLAQIAMIAGLPKAPSKNNPINDPERAIVRRNWILQRMYNLNFISLAEYQEAIKQPVTAKYHKTQIELAAPYVAETIRKQLLNKYGNRIYTRGYSVITTIDSKLQNIANTVTTFGLIESEERYGYRGPIANYSDKTPDDWSKIIDNTDTINILEPAIVMEVTEYNGVSVLMKNNTTTTIAYSQLKWAFNRVNNDKSTDNLSKQIKDILAVGDLIRVRKIQKNQYRLAQEPETQIALSSLDPNGSILAMVGGFNFADSMYNRSTQAVRQAGSVFKPFLYASALEHGMTAATIINDAPIVYEDKETHESWRPKNDNQKFNGPTRLREGLYLSRNLVSIRILRQIGLTKTMNYMAKIGFKESAFNRDFSMALGNLSITPLEMTSMYCVLANGGYQVDAKLISHVEINKDNNSAANSNDPLLTEYSLNNQEKVIKTRVMEARVNYIINDILKDVVYKTFRHRTKNLKRQDLCGKTGTTNDGKDTWFIGYNPDLITGIWVGKDNFQSIGENAYGANTTLPIWLKFMQQALSNVPEKKLDFPEGLISLKISPKTGKITKNNEDSIFELFRIENISSLYEDESNHKEDIDIWENAIDNIF